MLFTVPVDCFSIWSVYGWAAARYEGRADERCGGCDGRLPNSHHTSIMLMDGTDWWNCNRQEDKNKCDSPPRGSFHQSVGTGCICRVRLLYIWPRAVRRNARGDECASVKMEAIRVSAQGMTSSQGLILILWRVFKDRVWCVMRTNGGTERNGWNVKHLPLLYHSEFPTRRQCRVKIWIMKAQWHTEVFLRWSILEVGQYLWRLILIMLKNMSLSLKLSFMHNIFHFPLSLYLHGCYKEEIFFL